MPQKPTPHSHILMHSYAACSQHAPNEHILLSEVRDAIQLMAGLYWDLGEPGTPGK